MLVAFVFASVFFCFFLYFCNLLGFVLAKKITATLFGIIGIGGSNINEKQTSLPIPGISIKDFLWTICVREGRFSEFLQRIRKIGSITEFKLWSSRYVFINDYKLGVEILKDPVSNGRPKLTPHSHHGISGAYGMNWKDQKQYCQRHLKTIGFGTKSMETMVEKEVSGLIESWCDLKGKRFSPNKVFYIPVLSTIWKICTGESISINDQEMFRQVCLSYEYYKEIYKFPNFLLPQLLEIKYIKWIVQLLPMFRITKTRPVGLSKIRLFIRNAIQTSKNLVNVDKAPGNLIEAYLVKIKETTDENSNFFGVEGDRNLQGVIMDLFLAGGNSTASTLIWAILHLVRNQQIQEKIQAEIDTVVGNSRRPTIADRINCPYTEAFILENFRFSPSALRNVPHACTDDINVGSYVIQKDSLLFLNIYGIHHDPNEFEEPEMFKPERFLNDGGTTLLTNTALCTFSMGQRRCIGEPVARDTIFLFVSAICQRFVLLPDPLLNGNIPSLTNQKSTIHIPETFFMVAKEREGDTL